MIELAKVRCLLALTILVIGGTLFTGAFATAAQASSGTLHDVIPGGLPKNNDHKAAELLRERAEADPGLAQRLAEQGEEHSYNANNFRPVGYHHGAPAGSTNSGVGETGNLSTAQETSNCNKESTMLVLIDVKTEAKVYVCTDCSNPRLYHVSPPVFHKFAKGTVIKYHKTKSKEEEICGNGTKVLVTATITGILKAKTWRNQRHTEGTPQRVIQRTA